jgi:ATP-dependent Clp protease ATP-binding subunit ClpA
MIDDEARDWLADNGYDEQMGARPMQRLIQNKIKKELAEDILFGRLSKNGGEVHVIVQDGDLVLEIDDLVPA